MKVLVITTVFNCLAALFVAIRVWTRLRLVKNPGYDDLLISLALVRCCHCIHGHFLRAIEVARGYRVLTYGTISCPPLHSTLSSVLVS